MRKEDLIIENNELVLNELHCADSQSSLISDQIVEMTAMDNSSMVNKIDEKAINAKDVSDESSYIIDLVTSLDKRGKELKMIQSEVQTLLSETGELFSEYKVSVNLMKDKLVDRRNKLRKPKE